MADKSKDTGTGGININGDLYTPDVVMPNSPEDVAGGKQGTYSPGDIAVDKTVKDISKPTRETFAKYLSKTTLGAVGASPHPNKYPIGSGDATQLLEISLKDSVGNPTRPVTQNNENKFAINLNVGMGADNPAGIKKGLAIGDAPDGNTLLPTARNADGTLSSTLNTYATQTIAPNLNNNNSTQVVISDGELPAANIRDIKISSNVTVDGGTSKNILGDDATLLKVNTLTLKKLANVPYELTFANAFRVDLSTAPDDSAAQPAPIKPSSADVVGTISNASFFTQNVALGSSYSSALKAAEISNPAFQIKRGKVGGLGLKDNNGKEVPDGNKLLPSAATAADAGGKYVKPAKGLNDSFIAYTDAHFNKNLYKPTDEAVINLDNVAALNFFGPNYLHKPATGPADAGTFDNIQSDPSKSAVTKETLFKYFVDKVKGAGSPGGVGNEFKPSNFEVQTDFAVLDEKGYPASPTDAQNSPFDKIGEFSTATPTSYSENINDITFRRGKSEPIKGENGYSVPDGNSLLNDRAAGIALKKPHPNVEDYVSAVLRKNRFTAGSSFLNDNYLSEGPETTTLNKNASFVAPNQLRKGAYAGNNDAQQRSYGFNRLAQIGTVIQLRAAVELGSTKQGYNPSGALESLGALLPGQGQIGINVTNPTQTLPYEYIDVKNIIEDLTTDDVPETQFIKFNEQFEGTVNHVFEKFSGFSSIGMLALSAALVAAIFVAFEALAVMFGFFNGLQPAGRSSYAKVGDAGRPLLGTYNGVTPVPVGTNALDLLISTFSGTGGAAAGAYRLLGINPTNKYSLFNAVNIGMLAYFGIKGGKNFGYPGQAVVTARAIIRSTMMIILAFKDLSDILSTGNAVAGIEQVLNILDVIRSSRVTRAINVFAQIGDTQLTNLENANGLVDPNKDFLYDVTGNAPDAGRKISAIDFGDNGDIRYNFSKSRLKSKDGVETIKLAWASNRTPDLLGKANDATTYLASALGSDITPLDNDIYARTKFEFAKSSGRFSDDDRISIEDAFDSEYVPFYFHDLRTNEILGFHAFLTALTDSFSANYESTEAFGRIDPIMTYKNTTRKISLGFIVAALDKKDFDYMWAKINKLVTLVYPQYTAGKAIAPTASSVFTKPFSQLIGASPMIRLRIGDVITSNYSKFNLAGIFGLQNPGAKLDQISSELYNNDKIKEALAADAEKLRKVLDGGRDTGYRWQPVARVYEPVLPGPSAKPLNVSEYEIFEMEVVKKFADGRYTVKFHINNNANQEARNRYAKDRVTINNGDNGTGTFRAPDIDTVNFRATASDFLTLTDDSKKKLNTANIRIDEVAAAHIKNYSERAKDFLDESNNVIAKSFKSTGGRGIAGFIDNIDFDWLDSTWETNSGMNNNGRVAPKICKVTMGFTPIHDIAPGLDHRGINRAPIYQIASSAPYDQQYISINSIQAKKK